MQKLSHEVAQLELAIEESEVLEYVPGRQALPVEFRRERKVGGGNVGLWRKAEVRSAYGPPHVTSGDGCFASSVPARLRWFHQDVEGEEAIEQGHLAIEMP